MDDIVTWIRIASGAGSLSIITYLLTRANDPRSLIGGWRYRRDLREYFYLAVESDKEPAAALDWAVNQLADQWGRPDTPGPPERRFHPPGTPTRRARGPSP